MAHYTGPATVLRHDGTTIGEVVATIQDEGMRRGEAPRRWGGTLGWNRPDDLPPIPAGEPYILRLPDGREGRFQVTTTNAPVSIERGGFSRSFDIHGSGASPLTE